MASALNKIDNLLNTFTINSDGKKQRNHHHSWNNIKLKSSVINELRELQSNGAQTIPLYDTNNPDFDIMNKQTQLKVYNSFYDDYGAIIVRNAFDKQLMDEYNKWCESFLEIAKLDGNCRHPKQPGKYLINDIILRLAKDNAGLLMKLINNPYITCFCDILLGFMKYGSCTTHWIEPNGDRQLSHVDYPMHVGSGPFWEPDVNKLMQLTTRNQINNILPHFSIQLLIASDAMDVNNGSTEIIPKSHRISDIDVLIHDKEVYDELEPYFINVELEQGDFLIFNRRLVHRGGKNISAKKRNSLIMQCVWLWGVGQEIIEYNKVLEYLKECKEFNELNESEKETFLTRLKPPYPADIKIAT